MSSSSRSLTISYELRPPKDIVPPSNRTSASTKHSFEIKPSTEPGYKGYYAGLRTAIADARAKTGDELTEWRDAVGNGELKKEGRPVIKSEADEEEEEEEEEGDE